MIVTLIIISTQLLIFFTKFLRIIPEFRQVCGKVESVTIGKFPVKTQHWKAPLASLFHRVCVKTFLMELKAEISLDTPTKHCLIAKLFQGDLFNFVVTVALFWHFFSSVFLTSHNKIIIKIMISTFLMLYAALKHENIVMYVRSDSFQYWCENYETGKQ